MALGKRYRAEHIQPGLVGYPEDPEAGTILVTSEALDQMRQSFIGKPVVSFAHSDVSPEELLNFTKEQKDEIAVGVVSDAGKNPETGWDWVDMIIWDEETQKLIDEKGYSVSNAYLPEVTEEGGKSANVPFDHELVGGEYLHMAIVDNPRYEKARVFANSKPIPTEEKMGFKFSFGKKPEEKKPLANEAPKEEMDLTNAVVNMDGEQVPLEEMVNAYKAACAAKEATKNELGEEDMVEIDGQQVPVKALLDAYKASKAATNAEAPQDVQAEDVVDESKQTPFANAKPAAVNKDLKKAFENAEEPVKAPITKEDRQAEGRARYGSKVPQGGK